MMDIGVTLDVALKYPRRRIQAHEANCLQMLLVLQVPQEGKDVNHFIAVNHFIFVANFVARLSVQILLSAPCYSATLSLFKHGFEFQPQTAVRI